MENASSATPVDHIAMPHYEYTVITRDNTIDCGADPMWFKNHPEWNVLLRSNHKWPGRKVWISGGGETIDDAKQCLEALLSELIFANEKTITMLDAETFVVMPPVITGKESVTIIKD